MVKGVNRRIIEISSTGNEYFEKAVLYIRPNCQDVPEKLIAEEARCFLNGISAGRRPLLSANLKRLIAAALITGAVLIIAARLLGIM